MNRSAAILPLALGLCGCPAISGLDNFVEGGGGGEPEGYEGCLTPLVDDFEMGFQTPPWGYLGAQPTVIQGVGQFAWMAGATSFSAVFSQQSQNLLGCGVVVELVEPPSGPGYRALFYLSNNFDFERTGFHVEDGLLHMISESNVANPVAAEVSFDRDEMRWLRLREQEGLLFWDTSPNGLTWTTRHQAEVVVRLDTPRVVLGGASSLGLEGRVAFDNVNHPPETIGIGPEPR